MTRGQRATQDRRSIEQQTEEGLRDSTEEAYADTRGGGDDQRSESGKWETEGRGKGRRAKNAERDTRSGERRVRNEARVRGNWLLVLLVV
jgi:hypothetical protein